jgi:hypothetical protein
MPTGGFFGGIGANYGQPTGTGIVFFPVIVEIFLGFMYGAIERFIIGKSG